MAVRSGDEDQAFQRFVQEIKDRYRPEKVLLFGSRARKEPSARSDYDLLIVREIDREGVPL